MGLVKKTLPKKKWLLGGVGEGGARDFAGAEAGGFRQLLVLKIRLSGSGPCFVKVLGTLCAPFWHHVGALLKSFSTLWPRLGSLWAHLVSLWVS